LADESKHWTTDYRETAQNEAMFSINGDKDWTLFVSIFSSPKNSTSFNTLSKRAARHNRFSWIWL